MEIGKREIDFLGFKLGRDTKALTTSTRAKLEEMEKSAPPRTRKQLQSLLGTLNYIRELIPKYSREAKVLYSGTREGKWTWTEQMEQARLKLIRMPLESGELERRDDSLPLHVRVTEQEDEAMLTLSNEDGKAPIAFLTHQQESAMRRYDQNSAERVLASVTKRLLQLKSLAKEQPIIFFSMAGELARIKKNLVMDQPRINAQRWDLCWAIVLGDTQLDWRMIKTKRETKMTKYHDILDLPKYFTDGSERAGKVRWGYLVKHNGQLITSSNGEILGTAQSAEVTAVLKALQKAEELGHKEIVLTSDSEYVTDGINKELETWKANGFHNARNKPMEHREQRMNIAELLQRITTHCYHQVSHTKQDSEAAQGNREIDIMIGQVKMPETTELFQKLHDELNHPSVNMIQMELRLRNLKIPNWRSHYRETRKDCRVCRKFMTARGSQESELPKDFRGQQISMDFAGTIRPQTKAGNCYFLLAIDNHTKRIMIWAMKSALERNLINCLREWIRWEGRMQSLRADEAHNISGRLVEDCCKENKIVLTKIIPYRPETNRIAERAVRTVKEWCAKNKALGDWDTKIDECLIDLNRSAVNHNCRKEGEEVHAAAGAKENPMFRVGDQVILTRRRKVGRFNEGLGTVDTVKSITGTNTVELENNGIQSNKDLIKK